VIEPYYEPVFVPPRGRRDRERDWAKREREYYKEVGKARRENERARRGAGVYDAE
jgi:hypothetical protein